MGYGAQLTGTQIWRGKYPGDSLGDKICRERREGEGQIVGWGNLWDGKSATGEMSVGIFGGNCLGMFGRKLPGECPDLHAGLRLYVQQLRFVPHWLTHRQTAFDRFRLY